MKVAVIMGSDSDMPVMQEALSILRELGVPTERHILSAHRTPLRCIEFAQKAEADGIEVIIAGAGGAAHLAGVVAGLTVVPVIGVPIGSGSLNGLDSLLSIVQMPPGVPVATVGIGGARNAGILAAEILGVKDLQIRENVRALKARQAASVEAKDRALQDA